MPSLVFPELLEGSYELVPKGTDDVRLPVEIVGARVTTAAAGPPDGRCPRRSVVCGGWTPRRPQTTASSAPSGARSLAEAGDPEVAAKQQAYMKSAMPYYGLPAPRLKAVLRPLLSGWRPASREQWEATVLALWDEATHREEWYAAIAVARHRPARRLARPGVARALAAPGRHRGLVGRRGRRGDPPGRRRARRAPGAGDPSAERLGDRRRPLAPAYGRDLPGRPRSQVDTDLLRHAVEANLGDTSFWLRKAIGWALRDHARTDPDWVRAEVARLGDRLSGLSRREALKHLADSGARMDRRPATWQGSVS